MSWLEEAKREADRRMGKPRTEAEREEKHKEKYGEEAPEERGAKHRKSVTVTVLFYPPETVTDPDSFHRWFKGKLKSFCKVGLLPEYDLLSIAEGMKVVWER